MPLRTRLYLNGFALIRSGGGLYLLRANLNETPIKQSPGNKKYSSDHGIVIKLQNDHFASNDILLTNTVNGCNVYEWLKEQRELIHYKERQFQEPKIIELVKKISPQRNSQRLQNNIDLYLNDANHIYCFLEEHSCLATPLVCGYLALQQIRQAHIKPFSAAFNKHIKSIIPFTHANQSKLESIITCR
jgi:hypothetical protein